MRVLVDRNVVRNAVVTQSVLTPTEIAWGDKVCDVPVLTREARSPRVDEKYRIAQLPYLATVGEFARSGRISLFSSFELEAERWRQRSPDPGYLGFSLLEEVSIRTAPSPVGRNVVFGSFGRSVGVTEDEQMQFFRSLRDPRYREIREAVSDPRNPEAHMDDALHLWTAEVSGFGGFLSMDKRFISVVRNNASRVRSSVSVCSPKDLCERLGEGPTDLEVIAAKYPPFR
jgi:hypothetical protein